MSHDPHKAFPPPLSPRERGRGLRDVGLTSNDPLMQATVLLFALAKQVVGQPALTVILSESATVADLKAALARACPALAPLLPTLRIAVDSEYAPDDHSIPPGAELAAIPPVSGGSL